jgi:hypothetical protein
MAQLGFRPRQTRKRLGLAALSLGLAVIVLAACTVNKQGPRDGEGSATAGGNKAALCEFDADFNKASKSAQSEKDFLALIKSFEPRFDQVLADAPADIKRNVEIVIGGLRKIIKAGDTSAIDESGETFSEAGNQLDAYCGIKD